MMAARYFIWRKCYFGNLFLMYFDTFPPFSPWPSKTPRNHCPGIPQKALILMYESWLLLGRYPVSGPIGINPVLDFSYIFTWSLQSKFSLDSELSLSPQNGSLTRFFSNSWVGWNRLRGMLVCSICDGIKLFSTGLLSLIIILLLLFFVSGTTHDLFNVRLPWEIFSLD